MTGFLKTLQRQTSRGFFIPEIDGLRFLAIALVVLYHIEGKVRKNEANFESADGILGSILHEGALGVPLFFVISGFILALPFASYYLNLKSSGVNLKRFYWRRVTRLEPPYILSLLLLYLVNVIKGDYSAQDAFPNLLASIFYIHNISFGSNSLINGVAWSLEIEIQFYILTPLLTQIFRLPTYIRRPAMLCIMCIPIVIDAAAPELLANKSILLYINYFFAGFLLADFYLNGLKMDREIKWDAVFAGGLFLLYSIALSSSFDSSYAAAYLKPVIILIMYIAVFNGRYIRSFFSIGWITAIGGMCYTIYLLHYPVISFINTMTSVSDVAPYYSALLYSVLLFIPCILIVSTVFFLLVEKPCMNPNWPKQLKQHFLSKTEDDKVTESV